MAETAAQNNIEQIKARWEKLRHKAIRTARRLLRRVNSFRLLFRDIDVKTAVKLAISGAAVVAVGALFVAGADLSPAAIVRGAGDKYALSHATGDGFPVDIDGSRAIAAERVSNGTAVLTDTACTVLNYDGKEVLSETHYMANPVMKTADRYLLLFDRKSTTYTLRTLSGSLCTGKTDHPIITGAVSHTGRFALVTKHDTAHAHVCVYDKSGALLHKWKSSVYHISDIAVSPSGSLIALCGVTTTDEGQLRSCVIVQKVGGSQNLREYVFDGTLMFAVRFTDGDNVAVIGDDEAARVSCGAEKSAVYRYEGRTLGGFDISPNGHLGLVLSPHSDGQNASVVVLDAAAQETARLETDLDTPCLELTNSRIYLLSRSRFYSYTLGGKLVRNEPVPADAQTLLTSGSRVLVKGISAVTEVSD